MHDLRAEVDDEAHCDGIADDWRESDLSDLDRVLCEFAEKLTVEPSSIGPEDIQELRDAGLDDQGISSAVQVVAYFNYINRVAEGLGVPSEDWLHADGTKRP